MVAFAQQETPPARDNKSYVGSYILVALSVALGIWVVTRSLNRSEAEKVDLHAGKAPTGLKGQEFHE